MGYYFPEAKREKDLLPEQVRRYKELRSPSHDVWPPALTERLEVIKKHIGPITSGEILSALEELLQDAFVVWILADEDPAEVEWLELKNEEKLS